MTTETKAAIDFEAYTQGERLEMLGRLMKLHYNIGVIKIPETNLWCVPVEADLIRPNILTTLTVNPQVSFKVVKMIILEPVEEILEYEDSYETELIYTDDIVKTFFGLSKKILRREVGNRERRTKHVEYQRFETTPRGIWSIKNVFVGQRLQFPSHGNISGDAFGPDNELQFMNVCPPGVFISLAVENTSKTPRKFRAVILGTHKEDHDK